MLDDMFQKGVIRRSESAGSPRFGIAMLAIGMFEYHVDDLTRELVEMMHQYFDEAFSAEFFRSSLPQLRTSPHLKALFPDYIVDTYDNMRHFITHTKEPLYVANCVCKQGEALMGKPCRQAENYEVCLLIGKTGYAARGRAREISKEECLKILDLAEEKGMVLQPGNSRKPSCICICCGCCCGVLTTAKNSHDPSVFCRQLLRPHRRGVLHRLRRMRQALSDGRDHRGRQNLPRGSGSMHRLRPLRHPLQTQSRRADQERQGNRAADEYRDFVSEYPERKSRPEKNDRQYAEAAFRETPMMSFQDGDYERTLHNHIKSTILSFRRRPESSYFKALHEPIIRACNPRAGSKRPLPSSGRRLAS